MDFGLKFRQIEITESFLTLDIYLPSFSKILHANWDGVSLSQFYAKNVTSMTQLNVSSLHFKMAADMESPGML